MDPAVTYYCSRCNNYVCGGLSAFQRHLRSPDHVPPYVCGQGGCANQYMLRPSFYSHLRQYHSQGSGPAHHAHHGVFGDQDQHQDHQLQEHGHDGDVMGQGQLALGVQEDNVEQENMELVQEEQEAAGEELFPIPVDLECSAELALLNMRSINYMTGVAVESVQDQCFNMMQDTATFLKRKVQEFFSQPERNYDEVENLLKEFSLSNPFQKLKTKKQQMKCFESKYGMLVPEEVYIGPRTDSRLDPSGLTLQPTQLVNSFQYVTIIEIVKAVMSDHGLRKSILSEKASEDGFIRNFRDGSLFEKLPPELKDTVRIILYIDDLELLQALSAQKNIYKIAGFYFGIQNLPNELNALLTYIFVTALAYAGDAKEEKVWEPFLRDMRKLETVGVEIIDENGEPFHFKAVLIALIGDTLAVHEVLGLMSPSSSLFCRCCYIKRKDMWEDGTQLGAPRTPERHARDVQTASTGNILLQRATGVRGPSMLKGLVFFNSVENSPFDIFHDLNQGTMKMEVKLALREYVCIKKYFTISQLNSRIQFFNYGFTDKSNKPTANFTEDYISKIKSYNLPQTGSQMWCLTRAFGFLFGDLVPADDKFMKLIGLLNQITAIVYSRTLSEEDVNNLEELILAHHKLFQEIFPQSQQTEDEDANEEEIQAEETFQDVFETENVDEELHSRINEEALDDPDDADEEETAGPSTSRPAPQAAQKKKKKKKIVRMINKHHHMLHYADFIRRFGPLILYCCMRQEARHYFFKLAATVCHNFINVLKTLMEMFQMKITADRHLQRDNRVVMGKRGTQLLTVFDTAHSHQLVAAGVPPSSKVFQVNHVTFDRVDYRPGLFVTLRNQTMGSFPLFARITAIYVSKNEDSLYLLTQEWLTERFEANLCAYSVSPKPSSPLVVKQPAEITSYRLLSAWKRYDSDKTYLAPRTIA